MSNSFYATEEIYIDTAVNAVEVYNTIPGVYSGVLIGYTPLEFSTAANDTSYLLMNMPDIPSNIDNAVNNNKLLEGASNIDILMAKIHAKAKAKENELKQNINSNDPPNNPCKTFIVSKIQEAGIPVTAPGTNIGANTQSTPSADATRDEINSKWSGMDELVTPSFNLFA